MHDAGYVPLNSLRGGPQPAAPQLYNADLEAWRPELWDRDYNRRYRFNNTRVQRKSILSKGKKMKTVVRIIGNVVSIKIIFLFLRYRS